MKETLEEREIWKEVAKKTALLPTGLVVLAMIFELPVKSSVPVGIGTFLIAYPIFYFILKIAFATGRIAADTTKKILG